MFVVQYNTFDDCYGSWYDYPVNWDTGEPMKFETVEDAQAWIDNKVLTTWADTLEAKMKGVELNRPNVELYNKRKQVLKDAGLWDSEGKISPLTKYVSGNKYTRYDQWHLVPRPEMYQVVPFEESDWVLYN